MTVEQEIDRDAGDGLVTLSTSQPTALHDKPYHGAQGVKEKRATEKYVTPRSGSRRQRNGIHICRQLERLTRDQNAWRNHVGRLAYAPGGATKALIE